MGHDDEEAASSAMPHGGARWANQKTVLNNAPIKERLKWLVQLIFADADFNGRLFKRCSISLCLGFSGTGCV
jgi:hypothetical protein